MARRREPEAGDPVPTSAVVGEALVAGALAALVGLVAAIPVRFGGLPSRPSWLERQSTTLAPWCVTVSASAGAAVFVLFLLIGLHRQRQRDD